MSKEKHQPNPEEVSDIRFGMKEGQLTDDEVVGLNKEEFINFCDGLPRSEDPGAFSSNVVRFVDSGPYRYRVIRLKDGKLVGEAYER